VGPPSCPYASRPPSVPFFSLGFKGKQTRRESRLDAVCSRLRDLDPSIKPLLEEQTPRRHIFDFVPLIELFHRSSSSLRLYDLAFDFLFFSPRGGGNRVSGHWRDAYRQCRRRSFTRDEEPLLCCHPRFFFLTKLLPSFSSSSSGTFELGAIYLRVDHMVLSSSVKLLIVTEEPRLYNYRNLLLILGIFFFHTSSGKPTSRPAFFTAAPLMGFLVVRPSNHPVFLFGTTAVPPANPQVASVAVSPTSPTEARPSRALRTATTSLIAHVVFPHAEPFFARSESSVLISRRSAESTRLLCGSFCRRHHRGVPSLLFR